MRILFCCGIVVLITSDNNAFVNTAAAGLFGLNSMKNESRKNELIKFLVISFISVIIFILSITYGEIRYETNDDAIINMIAVGAYGEPSQYLVRYGILLGYFAKG